MRRSLPSGKASQSPCFVPTSYWFLAGKSRHNPYKLYFHSPFYAPVSPECFGGFQEPFKTAGVYVVFKLPGSSPRTQPQTVSPKVQTLAHPLGFRLLIARNGAYIDRVEAVTTHKISEEAKALNHVSEDAGVKYDVTSALRRHPSNAPSSPEDK